MAATVDMTISLGRFTRQHSLLLKEMEKRNFSRRLWEKDPTLWKRSAGDKRTIRSSLGWLTVPSTMGPKLRDLRAFSGSIKDSGFKHVLVLGMGGSSLAAMVFSKTFGSRPGYPRLSILDSTDPYSIKRVQGRIDPVKTLFVVASKSGLTIEVLSLFDYFHGMVKKKKGVKAGENFISITDPGTPLAGFSERLRFCRTFLNPADIGGRYSALSYFGLVPASLMGLDLERLLSHAIEVTRECSPRIRESQNPAVALGCALGLFSLEGRDKVTLFLGREISTFGLWLEQLLAESTGKEGKGLVPVTGEPPGQVLTYPSDRVFVSIGLKGKRGFSAMLRRLAHAGHPVITFELPDEYALGGEFFRWEVATAVAGAVLNINPFDQPDVEDAKWRTKRRLEGSGKRGGPAAVGFSVAGGNVGLHCGRSLLKAGGKSPGPEALLKRLSGFLKKGSYVAILAYLDPGDESLSRTLTTLRTFLRKRKKVATQIQYGPRYLHSTGQLHKGGPNNGVFIIIAHGMGKKDVPIPGRPYSFRELEFSQAMGDMEALEGKGRPVVLFDLRDASVKNLKEAVGLIKECLGREV